MKSELRAGDSVVFWITVAGRGLARVLDRFIPEVFGGFGSNVGEELHLDTTGRDVPNGYVEEDNRILRDLRP